jgi:hypothetical protein
MARRRKYVPSNSDDATARCANCEWEGTLVEWRKHKATWDDAGNPIKPECSGSRFFIDPDETTWSRVDRYLVLVRKNILAGMTPRKAEREAAYEVGLREPPPPMPEEVKALLRERAEEKREQDRQMKRRIDALKNARTGRRKASV